MSYVIIASQDPHVTLERNQRLNLLMVGIPVELTATEVLSQLTGLIHWWPNRQYSELKEAVEEFLKGRDA